MKLLFLLFLVFVAVFAQPTTKPPITKNETTTEYELPDKHGQGVPASVPASAIIHFYNKPGSGKEPRFSEQS